MRRIPSSCLILLSTLLSSPFLESSTRADEMRPIWVAHRRVDCIGVVPQKCYLIKDTQYEDWRFWYGEIEGFEYEEGYAYEILVRERKVEDPAADAAATQLELVEVLLKVETFETPEPEKAPPPPIETPALSAPEPIAPERGETVESAPTTPPRESAPPSTPAPESPQAVPAPPVEDRGVSIAEPTSPPPPTRPSVAPVRASETLGPAPVLRGHLTIGAGIEARSFKLCGAEEGIWVEDRTQDDLWGLYRGLASFPNRPVFMEVMGELTDAPVVGFGSHFQQQILIHQVRNASVESAGCFAEPAQFAFRASGNEPFWNLEISKRGLSFTELGQEDKLLFPYSPPTFFGEQIIYRSQIRGGNPRTLVVRLEEKPCSDTMADAAFSFSAGVKIDDRDLQGCALAGEVEP